MKIKKIPFYNYGITVIELVIAITISVAISIPVWMLYQTGLQTTKTGMQRLELMSEGQRITQKISEDLQLSATPYQGSFFISFDQLLKINSNSYKIDQTEFSFHRFCKSDVKNFSEENTNRFGLCKIYYRLQHSKNTGLYKLLRIEHCKKRTKESIISNNVNFFQIRPVFIQPEYGIGQWFWNVTIQLGKTNRHYYDGSGAQNQNLLIEDFYFLVSSDFFNSIWNKRFSPRNFNTLLEKCK